MALPSVRSGRRQPAAERHITDTQLLSLVRTEMDLSALWAGGAQSEERRRLMAVYLGAPRGDERPGRSQVVSRAGYETVEWAKPLLMSTFFGGPDVVQFRPNGPEDDEQAEQRTQAANFVFMRQNRGFHVTLTSLSDALIRRSGWIKVWTEESIQRERDVYLGKTAEEIAQLTERDADGEWEIAAQRPAEPVVLEQQDPQTGEPAKVAVEAWDVEIVRDRASTRVRVESVPPHEVYINPDARSPHDDTCRFVQHRQVKFTESRAIAMGFDSDVVRRIPTSHGGLWGSEEEDIARQMNSGGTWQRNERSDAERQIAVSECYVRADVDGDGITEWLKVFVGGDYGEVLLDWEPVSRHPFAQIQVIPLPHTVEGLSLMDSVSDLNDIETTTRRMFLDNLYFGVQGRWDVRVQGGPGEAAVPLVDMQQLANAIPGGWVYTWAEGALKPIANPVELGPLLETFALLTEDRHRRTGISAEAMGINPEAVSKTVFGAMAQQTGSQLRATLMAMCVGEGLRQVFELIDECLLRNPTQRLQAQLRGKWVSIDPSSWRGKLDAELAVGIGAGTRLERAMNLTTLLEMQKVTREAGNRWITDDNVHAALSEYVTNIGFRAPEKYMTDPSEMPEVPKPPDPADTAIAYEHHIRQQQVELEKVKLQIEAKKIELQHEFDLKKLELDHGLKIETLARDEAYRIATLGKDDKLSVDFGLIRDAAGSIAQSSEAIKATMIDNPLIRELSGLRETMQAPEQFTRDADGRLAGRTGRRPMPPPPPQGA